MTPDGHAILDRHPSHPNIIIGAGFSGTKLNDVNDTYSCDC